eukprot:jgi/Astpho2/7291/fgenesh1_pg.00113_%23_93_t
MAVQKEAAARTKVVLRGLPPTADAAEVQAAIDALCAGKYDWFTFVPGKVSNKRTVPAHAFLNFTSAADVLAFTVRMAGRSFGGEGAAKASQWRCTVEYAPHQRVPRAVGKPDNREGTLDKDADFLAFKEQLEKGPEPLPSAEAQLERQEAEARERQAAAAQVKKQKAEAPDRKAEGVLRQADRQADMKQIRNNLQAAAQVEERQAEALDRKAEGQEAAPTKVTTPLMRFLTEKHTPKTPKRTPSKKASARPSESNSNKAEAGRTVVLVKARPPSGGGGNCGKGSAGKAGKGPASDGAAGEAEVIEGAPRKVLYRPVPISNTKQEGRGKGKQARATRDQPQQQQSNAPEAVDAPPAKPVKLLRKANSTNAQQENGISSAPRLQAEAASQDAPPGKLPKPAMGSLCMYCLQDAPPGKPPKPAKGPKVRPGFQHYVPGAKRRQQPSEAGDEGSQGGSSSALKEAQAASSAAARGIEGGDHSGTQAAGGGSGSGKQWGGHERSKNKRSQNGYSGNVP